jgi:hypothetical protein
LYLIQDVVDFPFEEPNNLEDPHHPATPFRQEQERKEMEKGKGPVLGNINLDGDEEKIDNLPRGFPRIFPDKNDRKFDNLPASFPPILSATDLSYPNISLGSPLDKKFNDETNDSPSLMSLVKQLFHSIISLSYLNCLM